MDERTRAKHKAAALQTALIDAATPTLEPQIHRFLMAGKDLGDVVAVVADRDEPTLKQTFWSDDEWKAWGTVLTTPDGVRIVAGAHDRDELRADFRSRGGGLAEIADRQLAARPADGKMWMVVFVGGILGTVPLNTNLSRVLRTQGDA
jgi:hypothetical protein